MIMHQDPEDAHYHEVGGFPPDPPPPPLTAEELIERQRAITEWRARGEKCAEEIELDQIERVWAAPTQPYVIVRWGEGCVEGWTGSRWHPDLRRARKYLWQVMAFADCRGEATAGNVVREDRIAEWSADWGEE